MCSCRMIEMHLLLLHHMKRTGMFAANKLTMAETVVCAWWTHSCNLDQLVCIVCTIEEWLLPEHHARQRASQTPQIQAVVVVL